MTDEKKDPSDPTQKLAEINFHKNGFEIRTDLVHIAADYAKWQVETQLRINPSSIPRIPTYIEILEYAKAWNEFIIDCFPKKGGK